ncbi:MAG: hypothetical protein ABL967_01520 [Bryobacteraceae bacterium]
MTSNVSPANRISRGIYEMAGPRRITTEDAAHVVHSATNAANERHIAVVRPVAWEVDGLDVDSPIGELGSRLSVTVELLSG